VVQEIKKCNQNCDGEKRRYQLRNGCTKFGRQVARATEFSTISNIVSFHMLASGILE